MLSKTDYTESFRTYTINLKKNKNVIYLSCEFSVNSVSRKFLTLKNTMKGKLKMKKTTNTKALVTSALIAAIYCALTLALSWLSFGNMQFRIAESLTLLPIISPHAIVGVTLGCALSNAIGYFMGANILGAMDILFGTTASLIAAVLTWACRNVRFKNIPLLSAFFPVIVNAVVVGGELSFLFTGSISFEPFLLNAVSVFIPQFVICYTAGLMLVRFIEKSNIKIY